MTLAQKGSLRRELQIANVNAALAREQLSLLDRMNPGPELSTLETSIKMLATAVEKTMKVVVVLLEED